MLMGSKSCFLTQFRNTFYDLSKFNDIICYYSEYHSKLTGISNNAILDKYVSISIARILEYNILFLSLQEVVCM